MVVRIGQKLYIINLKKISMKILAIIPARMGSSRFPGKPLIKILGKPMIGHVFENVSKTNILTDTIVATCDIEIYDYIKSINGNAIMTSDKHQRASDRCGEALLKMEKLKGYKYDIVLNIQGDEPTVCSEMIIEALQPMISNDNIQIVNLIYPINNDAEFKDKNCIKVVFDNNFNALYFSREPIPNKTNLTNTFSRYKQVNVVPFRRNFLLEYINLEPTKLETEESIDMLRILEHGLKVKLVLTNYNTQSVDVYDDIKKVESIMLKC